MSEKILILHSLLSGFDILVAIILLVAIVNGLTTGLILKIGQIVAVIASYLLASLVAAQVGLGHELVFVIAFAVLSVVFHFLVIGLRLIDKIPVVGNVDRIGGAVVSFVVAFTVLYFFVNCFFHTIPQSTLDSWGWTKEAQHKTMFISGLLTD